MLDSESETMNIGWLEVREHLMKKFSEAGVEQMESLFELNDLPITQTDNIDTFDISYSHAKEFIWFIENFLMSDNKQITVEWEIRLRALENFLLAYVNYIDTCKGRVK